MAKRRALYAQVWQIALRQDRSRIYLWHAKNIVAHTTRLQRLRAGAGRADPAAGPEAAISVGIWLLKRLGQVLPTLLILSVLIFGLQQLMPGDPALILAGEERGDPQVLAQIRAELRLDQPLPEQYLAWLGRVVDGDFGYSWRIREPVAR